jgi:hypothetical protein
MTNDSGKTSHTELQLLLHPSPGLLYEADKRGITVLSWIETRDKGVSSCLGPEFPFVDILPADSCTLQTWGSLSLVFIFRVVGVSFAVPTDSKTLNWIIFISHILRYSIHSKKGHPHPDAL